MAKKQNSEKNSAVVGASPFFGRHQQLSPHSQSLVGNEILLPLLVLVQSLDIINNFFLPHSQSLIGNAFYSHLVTFQPSNKSFPKNHIVVVL